MMMAITNTTITIPTQTPASKISPITSQLERSNRREKKNKLKYLVGFIIVCLLFLLITYFFVKSFNA
jgi:hypothetical protein